MIQDRKKYPLPAWHASTELRAADLLGLEAYLLSRSQIADEDAIGIDRIPDWKKSIRFRRDGNTKSTVCVRDLRGITPGGHPVWLDPDDELEIDAEKIPPGALFDVWISVNNDKTDSPKFTLDITAAEEDSKATETTNPDNLYLGQYRLPHLEQAEDGLKVERRPVCRRLCAFGPVKDADWIRWTSPLRAKIEGLSSELASQSNRNVTTTALAVELMRLNYEWPILPIPILARRLRMVAWLVSLDGGSDHQFPDFWSAAESIDWDLAGEELPAQLTSLLPTIRENATVGIAESLPILLGLLSSEPVNYHAPIGLLKVWSDQLADAATRKIPDAEKRALVSPIESGCTANEWSKAVALITAMVLNVSISHTDVAAGAASALDQIYKNIREAQRGRLSAGPMAFYWLAKAAILQTGFANRRFQQAGGYFARLARAASHLPAGGSDRVMQYLDRLLQGSTGAGTVTPFTWWKKMAPREWSSGLRITLAGSGSSGKSSLARRILAGGGARVTTGYPGTGAIDTRGIVSSRNGVIDVSVLEIDCTTNDFGRLIKGASTDPVVNVLAASQLLILCITPAETDEWRSDRLKDLALWMRKCCPAVVVAIAYTKADEYGVVDLESLRFIATENQKSQLAKMQSANDSKREWDSFVQGKKTTTVNAGTTGGIVWTGQKTANGECGPTRQHILETTDSLWRALLTGEDNRPDLLLNGYFIAADSSDTLLEDDGHCGVRHLIADFLACLRASS